MVSTLDSESSDPSSNLGRTCKSFHKLKSYKHHPYNVFALMLTLHFRETFFDLEEVLKTPIRHIFKTSYEYKFSIAIYHLPRRLQDILKTFWKISSRCPQDVAKDKNLSLFSMPFLYVLPCKEFLLFFRSLHHSVDSFCNFKENTL